MPWQPADAARRAYAVEPRGFRLKWLAFRLYEAGELVEAEAMLALLPRISTSVIPKRGKQSG